MIKITKNENIFDSNLICRFWLNWLNHIIPTLSGFGDRFFSPKYKFDLKYKKNIKQCYFNERKKDLPVSAPISVLVLGRKIRRLVDDFWLVQRRINQSGEPLIVVPRD